MITSGGIKIYFLKQCKIRFIRSNEFTGSLYGVLHTFFAFCPGGSAAVHEETEVRCVSTETKVVGQCGVGFPGSQCRVVPCGCRIRAGSGSQSLQIFSGVRGRFHFQNQIVFDAMIAGIEIDDISDQHQQNHLEYDTKYFKNFLYGFFHSMPFSL